MGKMKGIIRQSKRIALNNPIPNIFHENKEEINNQENVKQKSCDITGDNSDCDPIKIDNNNPNQVNGVKELLDSLLNNHNALMMSEKGCSACIEAKDLYKKPLEEGRIKEIDINTPEGDLIDKHIHIKDTPTFLTKDKKGNIVKCFLYEDNQIYCGKGENEFKLKDT